MNNGGKMGNYGKAVRMQIKAIHADVGPDGTELHPKSSNVPRQTISYLDWRWPAASQPDSERRRLEEQGRGK
jgi:hypothetical protein